MPIYEYVCDKCNHELEAFQKLSEAQLSTCPECAEDALRKKVSAAGFRLKGSGWYETDFKSGKKKNVAAAERSSSSSGSSTSSTSSSSESSSSSSSSDSTSSSKSSSANKD
ncbi:MAG: zinc ribbon domain-containing protein [Pseudomonadota bacterium]|nr:zinc ribbon domain-containing protein [Pseudomonadota bacterium]